MRAIFCSTRHALFHDDGSQHAASGQVSLAARTWKPLVRALALNESATLRNRTTLYSEYSPSSATSLLDRGTWCHRARLDQQGMMVTCGAVCSGPGRSLWHKEPQACIESRAAPHSSHKHLC